VLARAVLDGWKAHAPSYLSEDTVRRFRPFVGQA